MCEMRGERICGGRQRLGTAAISRSNNDSGSAMDSNRNKTNNSLKRKIQNEKRMKYNGRELHSAFTFVRLLSSFASFQFYRAFCPRFLRLQFSFDRFILWHFIVSARARVRKSSSGFNYTLATRDGENKRAKRTETENENGREREIVRPRSRAEPKTTRWN